MKIHESNPSLEINTNVIDDYINSKMKSFKIPGLALSIVKNDQIVYLKGYGKSNVRGKPVTPQTPFMMGSIDKSFIGLAISQLIEVSKIGIDTPVQTYLPWFTLSDPEAARQITIKNLLSQTSGLPTLSGVKILLHLDTISTKQFASILAHTKISQPIGSKFQYCNLNYFILSEVIKAVSGMSYEQYLETKIFIPLDMKHSYTSQAEAQENSLATGYTKLFGFMIPFKRPGRRPFINLISSSEDMAHYMIAQLNNGTYCGNSVISSQGIAQTHTLLIPEFGHYGMGWYIGDGSTVPLGTIFSSGAIENFRANVYLRNEDDGEKWGVAVLINSMDVPAFYITGKEVYGNIARDIMQILHGQQPLNNYSPFKIIFSKFSK